MARRRSRGGEAAIWPGFVDGLSSLILVLMVVLSLFVVAQFYLGEELTQKDSELARLQSRIASLADQLGLLEAERDSLRTQITTLQSTLAEKEEELAGLSAALASSESAVAASAEELEAEKALSEEQKSEIATLNAQLAALRTQLASLQEALEAAEAKDREQQAQIENLSSRLNAALARKVQELAEVRSHFFEGMREVLANNPNIKVEGDRFILGSDLLFGSCSASLSEKGRLELGRVARELKKLKDDINALANQEGVQGWIIRVDGHADQLPLGPNCRILFDSNWELSTQRALSVVRYLEAQGVPGDRLVAAGFGDEYPLFAGRDAASLAGNRRIELKITQR